MSDCLCLALSLCLPACLCWLEIEYLCAICPPLIFPFPLHPCAQLQNSVTEYEFSQEEYRQLQVEFWSKFYACCLQYQEALSTPLALLINQATSMACVLKKVPPITILLSS